MRDCTQSISTISCCMYVFGCSDFYKLSYNLACPLDSGMFRTLLHCADELPICMHACTICAILAEEVSYMNSCQQFRDVSSNVLEPSYLIYCTGTLKKR